MPALAALAAAPGRGAAASAEGTGTENADATGGFADALELARDPRAGAKASRKSDPHLLGPLRPAAAAEADPAPELAQANIDATLPPVDAQHATEPAALDLSALLPGWPIAPGAAPVAAPPLAAAAPPPAGTVACEAPIAAALSVTAGGAATAVAPAVDSIGARNTDRIKPLPATQDGDQPDAGRDGRTRPTLPPQAGTTVLAAATKTSPPGQPITPAAAVETAAPAAPTRPALAAASVQALPVGNDNPTVSAAPAPSLTLPMPLAMAATPIAAPAVAAANALPLPFEARLNARLDSPSFAPALAHQVTWLVNEGVQQACLALNPAEMGPVTVRIVLDGSQARVDFSADLPATRTAIEASLPNLAASLHDSGLTLAGGGVSDGQQARHHGARDGQHAQATGRQAGTENAETGLAAPTAAAPRAVRGLVDLVA